MGYCKFFRANRCPLPPVQCAPGTMIIKTVLQGCKCPVFECLPEQRNPLLPKTNIGDAAPLNPQAESGSNATACGMDKKTQCPFMITRCPSGATAVRVVNDACTCDTYQCVPDVLTLTTVKEVQMTNASSMTPPTMCAFNKRTCILPSIKCALNEAVLRLDHGACKCPTYQCIPTVQATDAGNTDSSVVKPEVVSAPPTPASACAIDKSNCPVSQLQCVSGSSPV
jgi:hypothetical protein